jgi:hypothetical protein
VKDKEGNIVVERSRKYGRITSKSCQNEFNWNRNSLSPVNVVSGTAEEITCQEVKFAIGKMK